MNELLTFDRYGDTSYSASLSSTLLKNTRVSVKEEPAPYTTAQPMVATNDIWRWEEMFLAFQQIIARAQELTEPEIPEIFDLRPLATQHITVKIRESKPAQFRYISDMDHDDEG